MKNQINRIESSQDLSDWIEKLGKISERNVLFILSYSIIVILAMYIEKSGRLGLFFFFMINIIVYVYLFIYSLTIKKSKIINNTIRAITRKEGDVFVETFPYNILGLKEVTAKKVKLNIKNIKICSCDYPFKNTSIIEGKVYGLKDDNDELMYLILSCFPEHLEDFISLLDN